MARVAIAINSLLGSKNPAYTAALTVTSGDASNDHEWALQRGDMLYIENTDASSHTANVIAVADPTGRTEDVNLTGFAAGARLVMGPFNAEGWAQTDGKVQVNVDHASFRLAVLRPPAN